MNRIIDIALKIGIVAVLVVAASKEQEYSYYTFVRWCVTTAFIYFSYRAITFEMYGILIFYVMVAILFNPFIPFRLEKEIWHLIDYLVSFILILTIYFDHKQRQKLDNF